MTFKLLPAEIQTSIVSRIKNKLYRDFILSPRRNKIRKHYIESLPEYGRMPGNELFIHSLMCKRDVEMGICTYKTLNHLSNLNFNYIIHDDGSLTTTDINFISRHIKASVITRKESNLKAETLLKDHPHILNFRRNHFLALKIIDVSLFDSSDRIVYLDSDILFFKKPDFFITAFADRTNRINYFNKDLLDAYIDSPEKILHNLQVSPFPFINAGLWVMNKSTIDFEKIETWLSTDYIKPFLSSYRLEQTLVSMLANISNTPTEYLPQPYNVDLLKSPSACISKHYVGKIRHGYELEGLSYLQTLLQLKD